MPDREIGAAVLFGESVTLWKPDTFSGEDIDPVRLDPRQRELLDYWRGLREGAERMPRYQRFDPIDISRLLGDISVLDVHWQDASQAPRYRFRLYGTRVAEARGKDLTGQWTDTPGAFSPHIQKHYEHAFEAVARDGVPMLQLYPWHMENRRQGTYHRLHVPFWSSDPARVDQILISFLVLRQNER